jgi:uncharacterized protein (TIGR02145 family)
METGTYRDSRDGKEYRTLKIGSQVWFADNLAFPVEGAYPPAGDEKNCVKFGRLYTLKSAKAACPDGCRIPSESDWQDLIKALGGDAVAGGKMMLKEGWTDRNLTASNESGFSAMGAGLRTETGEFNDFGFFAHFWSTTDFKFGDVISFYCMANDASVTRQPKGSDMAISVRCVKNG